MTAFASKNRSIGVSTHTANTHAIDMAGWQPEAETDCYETGAWTPGDACCIRPEQVVAAIRRSDRSQVELFKRQLSEWIMRSQGPERTFAVLEMLGEVRNQLGERSDEFSLLLPYGPHHYLRSGMFSSASGDLLCLEMAAESIGSGVLRYNEVSSDVILDGLERNAERVRGQLREQGVASWRDAARLARAAGILTVEVDALGVPNARNGEISDEALAAGRRLTADEHDAIRTYCADAGYGDVNFESINEALR